MFTQSVRDLQVEFARFNGGVERARRAYEAQPIASCDYPDCDVLMDFGERWCPEHFGLLTKPSNRKAPRVSR